MQAKPCYVLAYQQAGSETGQTYTLRTRVQNKQLEDQMTQVIMIAIFPNRSTRAPLTHLSVCLSANRMKIRQCWCCISEKATLKPHTLVGLVAQYTMTLHRPALAYQFSRALQLSGPCGFIHNNELRLSWSYHARESGLEQLQGSWVLWLPSGGLFRSCMVCAIPLVLASL